MRGSKLLVYDVKSGMWNLDLNVMRRNFSKGLNDEGIKAGAKLLLEAYERVKKEEFDRWVAENHVQRNL
jgi:hypothetical protein